MKLVLRCKGEAWGVLQGAIRGEVAPAGKHLVVAWDGGRLEVERRDTGRGHEALEKPS